MPKIYPHLVRRWQRGMACSPEAASMSTIKWLLRTMS